MCTECETSICDIFDELVNGYRQDYPHTPIYAYTDTASVRPKYMSLEVRNHTESRATENRFKDMVEAATGIGYDPGAFMAELVQRSGFKDHVHGWAQGKIPNGLARKIILTCAEMIIREAGARPALTFQQAA